MHTFGRIRAVGTDVVSIVSQALPSSRDVDTCGRRGRRHLCRHLTPTTIIVRSWTCQTCSRASSPGLTRLKVFLK